MKKNRRVEIIILEKINKHRKLLLWFNWGATFLTVLFNIISW